MKTEDLIANLAEDTKPAAAATIERGAGLGLVSGGAVAIALFLTLLGPRAGLGAALNDPPIFAKTLLPLGLGVLALLVTFHAARPAVPLGWPARLALAVPAAAGALFVWAFATTEGGERLTLFLGQSIPVCLPAIPLLSLPILAGLMLALKRGAPVHPAACGAVAGLAAAGLAAALYSLSCTEDTPLFYSVWYSLAIAAVAGIGAGIGARYLRW